MAKMEEMELDGSHPFDEFQIGDQVKHPLWGVGTILYRSGVGENSKVIVVFPEEGQKKLALRYANLKKIMDAKAAAPVAPIAAAPADEDEEEAVADPFEEEIEDLDDDEEEIISPEEMDEENPFGDDDYKHLPDQDVDEESD
ncbi:MAG: DNA-dependent helicase II [candidate division BRC1 bacterium ADurb.BinA364]|nr:MAG: DNA-dependent helicase II [candidate division BRC1 bacterium ADurb.BinA364]